MSSTCLGHIAGATSLVLAAVTASAASGADHAPGSTDPAAVVAQTESRDAARTQPVPLDHWQPQYLPRTDHGNEYDAADKPAPATPVVTIEDLDDPGRARPQP